MTTPYLFVCSAVGTEKVLKSEISKNHPELNAAFQRPGFVTFKHKNGLLSLENFRLKSILAREYSFSFGELKDLSQLEGFLKIHFQDEVTRTLDGKIATQVFSRLPLDSHDQDSVALDTYKTEFKKTLPENLNLKFFETIQDLKPETPILQFCIVDPGKVYFGIKNGSASLSPYSGCYYPEKLPEYAPSRAYLKLKEALDFSKIKLTPGENAVEVGSAPGGACLLLLEKGLKVVGIDPGEMDPIVLKNENFFHIRETVHNIKREELPEKLDWLLVDMNVNPWIALKSMERLAFRSKDTLKGCLFTLKMNDWDLFSEFDQMLEFMKELHCIKVRAKKLSTGGQEIFVLGLTRKGTVTVL